MAKKVATPKLYKNLKIMGVTAYPLDKEMQNEDNDYFAKFSKGFRMPEIKEEFLIPNLRNAAKGIMAGGQLSYKYKAGHITMFHVRYKKDSKSGIQNFAFVTKKGEK